MHCINVAAARRNMFFMNKRLLFKEIFGGLFVEDVERILYEKGINGEYYCADI